MDPACRPTRTIKNLRKRYPSVPYAADSPCNLNEKPLARYLHCCEDLPDFLHTVEVQVAHNPKAVGSD